MPTPALPDPADLQKFFENWWRTGSTIVATLAGALISLQISSPVAYAVAVAVTVIGIALAIVLYRREARGREKDEEVKQGIGNKSLGSTEGAFRGLRRFLRGELLPGPQRRRDAAQLFRQVIHPAFKIAVVTGDSGAGKSSMLECALVGELEAAGHGVAMISNSGLLVPLGQAAAEGSSQIQLVIAKIAEEVSRHRGDGGKAVVLILDQFEELLSRFRAEQDRNELGDALWKLIEEGTRVIVGMRKEHLVDFRSIATRLGYTISLGGDTFLVENFDTKEAAAVIRECAKQDGIVPDQDLPELIADDLAVDGRVRPADLQIICTALSGDLTIERYRSEGRASGLRSHFIKGVMGITGDTALARAVLRELCDIPNNKKAPDPLRAEDIAEKARLGAPGQRATTEAVIFVLRALQQALVVVSVGSAEALRWSLIHDYLVEAIKIATEEQTTRSEAAVARLDYFVTRGSIIPLPELRSIRRDAPPAAVRQPAARRLILRSLLIGYGKPLGGASAVALVAVALVVVVTTERQWRIIDEKSHWDGSSMGKQSPFLFAYGAVLQSDPSKPLVIFSNSNDSTRLTTWDAETGSPIAVLSGQHLSVAGGGIWDYDAATGRLKRLDGVGKEILSLVTPQEGRPQSKYSGGDISVAGFQDGNVIFDVRYSDMFVTYFDLQRKKWKSIVRDQIAPPAGAGYNSISDSYRSTELLNAVLERRGGALKESASRLTVWTRDYGQQVFDEQFTGDGVSLLGLTQFDGETILSLINGRVIETILIKQSADTQADSTVRFSVGERKQIPLPKDFPLAVDEGRFLIRNADAARIVPLGKRIVVVETLGTRTVFWVFNPAAARFDDPMFGAPAVFLAHQAGYAWISYGTAGPLKIWLPDQPDLIRVEGVLIRQNDGIELSDDRRRLLVVPEDGGGELWSADFSNGKASRLARIAVPPNSNLSLNSDQKLIVLRRPGGLYYAWDRNGAGLGSLGVIGSEIQYSSYRGECRQILLWTREGQRLDLRRGFKIPLYGFLQERDCSGHNSWSRRIFERILDYFAG
jgi:hypothetical protein